MEGNVSILLYTSESASIPISRKKIYKLNGVIGDIKRQTQFLMKNTAALLLHCCLYYNKVLNKLALDEDNVIVSYVSQS